MLILKVLLGELYSLWDGRNWHFEILRMALQDSKLNYRSACVFILEKIGLVEVEVSLYLQTPFAKQ